MDPQSSERDEGIDRRVDALSKEFAQHAGVLAEVFAKWSQPDVARAVVQSVIEGDGETFGTLIDVDSPIPPLDRCIWLSDMVEKVIPASTTEVCRLRSFLTPEERRTLIEILLRFRVPGQATVFDHTVPNPVIPPGALLDALKAAGLVDCGPEPVGNGLELVFEPPRRFCI